MIDEKDNQTLDILSNSLVFGYARVSTKGQNLDLQVSELKKYGCNKIFEETASTRGKLPELARLIDTLRKGDTLVVWKLDRLGRSVLEVVNLLQELSDKEVELVSITQDIDTKTPMGKVFSYFIAIFSETERNLISERTKRGLEEARKRGVKGGAKYKLSANQIKELKIMYDSKKYTVQEIADHFEVTRSTVYSYLKKFN